MLCLVDWKSVRRLPPSVLHPAYLWLLMLSPATANAVAAASVHSWYGDVWGHVGLHCAAVPSMGHGRGRCAMQRHHAPVLTGCLQTAAGQALIGAADCSWQQSSVTWGQA